MFVHTAQQEFNYPGGEQNVYSRYEGKGGFPDLVASPCAWPPRSTKASPIFC